MVKEHGTSVRAACTAVNLDRGHWYYRARPRDDAALIEAFNGVIERKPRWGFWLSFKSLRREGHGWNHKRVYRVYKALGLNIRRRAKKRLPARVKQPLSVPERPNQGWSADFMSDTLYSGRRFRLFTLMDDFNREGLALEADTSLPAERIIRVLDEVVAWRGAPARIRVDNGPEFLAAAFVAWAERNGVEIVYIQPGKPTQNAFIERFNGTVRHELLDLYVFYTVDEVREMGHWWLEGYNTERPHDSLNDQTPEEYLLTRFPTPTSTLELS